MSPERDLATDSAALFAEAVSIMARLRGPNGCPWDHEQTFDTIRKHTLEETYEVFDAIERRHWNDLCEELGDLLLQVLFYAQMASEPGYFTIADVIAGLNRKLIRRHPHVFRGSGLGCRRQRGRAPRSRPRRSTLGKCFATGMRSSGQRRPQQHLLRARWHSALSALAS